MVNLEWVGIGNAAAGNLTGYLGNNNTADSADAANRMMYGDNQNPYLKGNVQSALDSLSTQFRNQTLPGLRRTAIGNGTYGSSRNELGEAQAGANMQKQMFDTSAQMYADDYNRTEQNRFGALQNAMRQDQSRMGSIADMLGQGAQNDLNMRSLGLQGMQSALNGPMAMLQAQMDVGNQQYNQSQNELSDATNRWNFDQNAEWENLNNYNQILQGLAGYGQSQSGTGSQMQTGTSLLPTPSTGQMIAGLGSSALGLLGALKGSGAFSGGGSTAVRTPSLGGQTYGGLLSSSITPSFGSGRY